MEAPKRSKRSLVAPPLTPATKRKMMERVIENEKENERIKKLRWRERSATPTPPTTKSDVTKSDLSENKLIDDFLDLFVDKTWEEYLYAERRAARDARKRAAEEAKKDEEEQAEYEKELAGLRDGLSDDDKPIPLAMEADETSTALAADDDEADDDDEATA